jgi:hypothetical protein
MKASPVLKQTNFSDNQMWGEVCTLLRIALLGGCQATHASHNQLYVPEIVHIVSLVAGMGTTIVRKSVYGIMMNLLQCLYLAHTEEPSAPQHLQLIADFSSEDALKLFGLVRPTPTSEYASFHAPNDKVAIDNQEQLAKMLSRVLEVTAESKGESCYPLMNSTD